MKMITPKNLLFIGLGRIGLPQALVFADHGLKVFGYDQNQQSIELIQNKTSTFEEKELQSIIERTANQNFLVTSNWQEVVNWLPEIDVIFFTIGTTAPSRESISKGEGLKLPAHYSILKQIFDHRSHCKKDIIVVFRTTLPLGSTDLMKKYIENKSNLLEGKDFHLAFVPERIVEGNAIEEEQNLPKIIGAYNDAAFTGLKNLFSHLPGKIIRVDNPLTAEFCKLSDNSFRDTIFSFSNDLAMFASTKGIDIEQVIRSVNDSYTRNNIPRPGFVSGYCLGKDPYIFEIDFLKKLQHRKFHSLWYYGRRTNDYLIRFITYRAIDHINSISKPIITVLGLSFKEEVDDFRMSHGIELMNELLANQSVKFKVYDNHLDDNNYTSLPSNLSEHILSKHKTLSKQLFQDANVIIICNKISELEKYQETSSIENLLVNTSTSCFLLDVYKVWPNAKKLKNIKYQSFSY